jgi:hypothetical protein
MSFSPSPTIFLSPVQIMQFLFFFYPKYKYGTDYIC